MARGNGRQGIVADEVDRQPLLGALDEAGRPSGNGKGTSLNYAQQKRKLGGEEGTSEGNLVALA